MIELEIDNYLNNFSDDCYDNVSILKFWQKQELMLPLLSRVARKYLSIPTTNAASERLFSEAGNVITSKRTLLNVEKAEQLIFIHDNFESLSPLITSWKVDLADFKYSATSKEPLSQLRKTTGCDSRTVDVSSESDMDASDIEFDHEPIDFERVVIDYGDADDVHENMFFE